jgi:transposase-like protein
VAKGIRYTEEQKQNLISEYEASGMSLSKFCSQQDRPSYAIMSKWIQSSGLEARQLSRATAVGSDSALFSEFTQSLMPDDVQVKYIRFLEKRIRDLEAQLTKTEG